MSEDHATLVTGFLAPLDRARRFLERRGETLPEAALRALAREVILRVSRVEQAEVTSPRAGKVEISALCDALLSPEDAAAAALVRSARLAGMPTEEIYQVYLAGAARMLGDRWDRDEATVPQVIIGAGRVYGILRELREAFLSERLLAPPGAAAVFAVAPGETHGIGATVAADMMRQKGWDISLRLALGHDALVEEIGRLSPTMVGLSSSRAGSTFAIARLIVALRVRCPQVWIILGGAITADDPEIGAIVDADAVAFDMEDGAQKMADHLALLNRLATEKG